jgi:hypothetical protein
MTQPGNTREGTLEGAETASATPPLEPRQPK